MQGIFVSQPVGELFEGFGELFCQYLEIHKFVWTRVVCGARCDHCASIDCLLGSHKIDVRNHRLDQDFVT